MSSTESTSPSRKAVILLSGGLDSTTTLAIALDEGVEAHALTIRYGQRHEVELEAARRVAERLGAASHREIAIDLGSIGGSALTADIPVPRDGEPERREGEIPVTYVPARNTVLLAIGLAWAEVLGAGEIFIGVNAVDYSGYPDCRPEFIEAFERLARVATRAAVGGRPVRIRAPLLDLSKADIVRRGLELGVDYALTSSCYDPGPEGVACGRCDACVLRRRGFEAAGVPDPALQTRRPD